MISSLRGQRANKSPRHIKVDLSDMSPELAITTFLAQVGPLQGEVVVWYSREGQPWVSSDGESGAATFSYRNGRP